MCQLRLERWEAACSDSHRALDLEPQSMKAHYYLAQAYLALRRPHAAHEAAVKAYERCLETQDKSLQSASELILQTKKARWQTEKRRQRLEQDALLRDCVENLRRKQHQELEQLAKQGATGPNNAEYQSVLALWTAKEGRLHEVFEAAQGDDQEKAIPDYLIDSISFCVMHDPVMTKTGNSYERAILLDHLQRSQTDPLTREPLTVADLRPNLALKQACNDFLDANGWAVDY